MLIASEHVVTAAQLSPRITHLSGTPELLGSERASAQLLGVARGADRRSLRLTHARRSTMLQTGGPRSIRPLEVPGLRSPELIDQCDLQDAQEAERPARRPATAIEPAHESVAVVAALLVHKGTKPVRWTLDVWEVLWNAVRVKLLPNSKSGCRKITPDGPRHMAQRLPPWLCGCRHIDWIDPHTTSSRSSGAPA